METKPGTAGTETPENPAATAWLSGIDLTMKPRRRNVALCWLLAVCLPMASLAALSDRFQAGQALSVRTGLMAAFSLLLVAAGYAILKAATRRVEVGREIITVVNMLGSRRSMPLRDILLVKLNPVTYGLATLVITSAAAELRIVRNALTATQLAQIQTLLLAKGGPCPLTESPPPETLSDPRTEKPARKGSSL